jgi:RND family efflux transporter MFP subunit
MVKWKSRLGWKSLTIALMVSLSATSLAGCSSGTKAAAPTTGRNGGGRQLAVEVQQVKKVEASGGQVFTGVISPVFTTNVSSKISGRVTDMMVKVGDAVKSGSPLAKIDTSALQQQLEQSTSAKNVTQAQLTKTQNDLQNNVNSAQLALQLTQAQLDKTIADQKNAVVLATQAVTLAQSQLDKAQSDQQNSISAARQSVTVLQTQLNKAISDASTTLSNAQNAVNSQQIITDNNLQNLQTTVSQSIAAYDSALAAYNAAPGGGTKSALDAAVTKLQGAELALQQSQQLGANANSSLASALAALISAQNSQTVQVAQEQLNQQIVLLANAQNTTTDVNQKQLQQQQAALNNALTAQQANVNVSKLQLSQSEQALKNTSSTDVVSVGQAQLEQANASIHMISEQLKDGVLNSPVDGVVTAINTPIGQNAGTGSSVISIASMNPIVATVNVSEAIIGKIKVGSTMNVKIPTLNKTFDGQVYTVHPTLDVTTKSYGVDIKIADPNNELLPGMFAEASQKSEGRQTIMVPADAVLSQTSGNIVFIVDNGKAKKVTVTLGEITSTTFEITKGLNEGDQLVVKGQELLSDNVTVQIAQPGQSGQGQGKGQSQSGQGQSGQGQSQSGQGKGQGGQGGQGQGQGQGKGKTKTQPTSSDNSNGTVKGGGQ